MPTWAWVLTIIFGSLGVLLGLLALGLALFRIRYFLEWRGAWDGGLSGASTGTAIIESGFPGFKHTWEPLKDASWTLADLIGGDDDEDENVEAKDKPNAVMPQNFLKAPDRARHAHAPVGAKLGPPHHYHQTMLLHVLALSMQSLAG